MPTAAVGRIQKVAVIFTGLTKPRFLPAAGIRNSDCIVSGLLPQIDCCHHACARLDAMST